MSDAYVLWHEQEDERDAFDYASDDVDEDERVVPIGYVSFGPASLASTNRRKLFGKHFDPDVVNKWFSNVSRVVLDPRYRGAGIASTMLRESCKAHARRKSVKYIEAKTSMGAVNRFNQAAGFRLIGENDQLEQAVTAGGGTMGLDREDSTGEVEDRQRIRKIYEFIMDTEDELGVDLDY